MAGGQGRRAERQHFKVLIGLTAAVLAATGAPAQTKNPRQLAEAAILKADRDFNQAAVDRDMERFLSFVSENAVFDSADGPGREAVRKAWAPFFEPNGPAISWTPTKAESLVAGDVGYTVGTWLRGTKDARGKVVGRIGQYLTVWRKEKDGVWRVTFDTGSTAPARSSIRPLTR
jgi:ketosteroid isomerase-like protein